MATQVDLTWMGVGLVISGLVFYLAVRFSARKAEQALGETMRAASAIVSGGLASDDPESGPDAMLAELARLLDADASVIAIPTGDGQLACGASFGYPEPDKQFIKIEQGMSGRAFTTGNPVIAPDVTKEPSYEPTVEGMRSAVAVPLRVGGRIVGALDVESSHRRYTERDLAVLAPLADQIAALLENQRLTRAEEDRRASEGRARDEIDGMKDDFLATVSHELRTPLTSIKGSAQTMLSRDDALTDAERVAFLQVIVRQCDRLAKMVDTLLLVSRLESDDVPGRSSYVLLRDLLNNAAEAAGGHDRVTFDLHGPPGIITDQFRAHHVIRNLIENACKYSSPQAPVLVRVRGTEEGIVVEVLDRGPGLPEGSEEAAFERFRRLENPDLPSVSGSGLGLYIARRFARELGGEIEVGRGDEEGWKGARFALHLPSS